MNKKKILYLFYLLIFIGSIVWLLDYNFTKKQFTFLKLKSLLSKNTIAFLKKKASSFIDFDFEITQEDSYQLEDRKVKFEKYSNKFLKYRYYIEQDETNIYLITNRGELFYLPKLDIL